MHKYLGHRTIEFFVQYDVIFFFFQSQLFFVCVEISNFVIILYKEAEIYMKMNR